LICTFWGFFWKVRRAPEGSNERYEAQKELDEVISHRKHVDQSIAAIREAMFGEEKAPSMLNLVRAAGQALVDDWDCLKAMVWMACNLALISLPHLVHICVILGT